MAGQLYPRVVERADSASALIAELDLQDPDVRARVVDAVTSLYEHFVAPAAGHLSVDAGGTAYYDLEAAAGTNLSGLTLGLLARELPALQAPPDDARLAAIDAEYGIGDTPERRRAFFQTWMAERATRAARTLLEALDHEPSASPAAAEAERDRLRALLAYPLPSLERALIQANIERRAGRG